MDPEGGKVDILRARYNGYTSGYIKEDLFGRVKGGKACSRGGGGGGRPTA
jgi:hypothetical protein